MDNFKFYRRNGFLKARVMSESFFVGDDSGRVGDYLVQNEHGEQWIITAEDFETNFSVITAFEEFSEAKTLFDGADLKVEPGITFWEDYSKNLPLQDFVPMATNPCCEIFMADNGETTLPYDSTETEESEEGIMESLEDLEKVISSSDTTDTNDLLDQMIYQMDKEYGTELIANNSKIKKARMVECFLDIFPLKVYAPFNNKYQYIYHQMSGKVTNEQQIVAQGLNPDISFVPPPSSEHLLPQKKGQLATFKEEWKTSSFGDKIIYLVPISFLVLIIGMIALTK